MKLAELLKVISPLAVSGNADQDITGLYYDSRQVKPGGLFFALKGVASDGSLFIDKALQAGAVAVVGGSECQAGAGTVIRVTDPRLAMSLMAARFYGTPTALVPLIGITGTNGKTTTTYLLESILEQAGLPAAVLGTVNYRFRDRVIPAPNTTPESVDLQQTLRELVDLGAAGVVMEVSSHALEQRRVDGCCFDVAIFSNLTRDHLDYHHDMESYFQSKARFFSELLAPSGNKVNKRGVVNIDDPYAARLVAMSAAPVLTYGVEGNAEISPADVSFTVAGISCNVSTPAGVVPVRSPLLGRFNLYNILSAIGGGVALGLPLSAISSGIENLTNVPGRLERVANQAGITVLVDYAHTGDALENVLRTVEELKTGRIITVFGCGGDRDRGKRPVMGAIAGRFSDLSIITSDNPRTERAEDILAEIHQGIAPLGIPEFTDADLAAGFSSKGFVTEISRRAAIRLAIRVAERGDIVLIAGKGHEDYQIIGTEKQHFDDREEAASALHDLKAGL
jgi:UDP-N-acetylmuramoyl-L-alanyl-D-glutamate--2,6-diaminopimelate ligase